MTPLGFCEILYIESNNFAWSRFFGAGKNDIRILLAYFWIFKSEVGFIF